MAFKLFVATVLLAVATGQPYRGFNLPIFGGNIDGRVVGGYEAERGQFPHQVSLQWGIVRGSHFCGGSIINDYWVVTAGHCILAVPSYGKFEVKAGKHALNSFESSEQVVEVSKTFVHSDYVGGVGPFDIALIKLKTPLTMTKSVAAIGLPPTNSEPTGEAHLSGWGSISTTSSAVMPNELQTVEMTIVDRPTCKDAIVKLTGSAPVHDTNICTGPLTGGISACSGDSGGPLMAKGKDGSLELIGIVSWGIIPCGTPGAPSVYTKVSSYIDWMNKVMDNN